MVFGVLADLWENTSCRFFAEETEHKRKRPKKGSRSSSEGLLSARSKTPAFGNGMDIFFVGHLKWGKVYLPAVVGANSSFASGFLYDSKTAKSCVSPRRKALQVL